MIVSDEMRLALARKARDMALARSDVTQLPDYPLTDEQREAWRVYRQTLRDLPQSDSPLVLPVPPARITPAP